MWPFSRRRKPPQEIIQPFVEFVGEQDGPPEREFKSVLCRAFKSRPEVSRAYLCRVRYDRAATHAVVLAISAPEDPSLADQVGQVFWQMFGRGVPLDIMFVESDMELRLAKVCAPFYRAG